jgi:hypothetical protein
LALPGDLHDQRQHVERRAGPARPAEVANRAGEVGVARVPDDHPVRLAVAGVPDQLLVPDPRAGPLRRGRGEHGERRSDPSAVGCLPQVREGLGRDLVGAGDVAAVPHPQAAPVEPADAAAAVAPGNTGAEGQLAGRVGVGAVPLDLRAYLRDPRANRRRGRVLRLVEGQELLSRGRVDPPRCPLLAGLSMNSMRAQCPSPPDEGNDSLRGRKVPWPAICDQS